MPSGESYEIVDRLARMEEQLISLVKIEKERNEGVNSRIDQELGRAKEVHEEMRSDIDSLWTEMRRLRKEYEGAKNRILGAILATAALGGLIGSGLGNLIESGLSIAGGQ